MCFAIRHQVYWGQTHVCGFLLVLWFDIAQTQTHTKTHSRGQFYDAIGLGSIFIVDCIFVILYLNIRGYYTCFVCFIDLLRAGFIVCILMVPITWMRRCILCCTLCEHFDLYFSIHSKYIREKYSIFKYIHVLLNSCETKLGKSFARLDWEGNV